MWRLEKAKLPPGRVLGGPWRWLPHPPQDPHAPEEEWEQAKRELWQLYLAVLVALLTGALAILVWWNGATTSHPDRLSGWRRTESGISWTL